jgi:hypothetical protein
MKSGAIWCLIIFVCGFWPFYATILTLEGPALSACRTALFLCRKGDGGLGLCDVAAWGCSRLGERSGISAMSKVNIVAMWLEERWRRIVPASWSRDWTSIHLPVMIEWLQWSLLVATWASQPFAAFLGNNIQIRTIHRVLLLQLIVMFGSANKYSIPCSQQQLGGGFFLMALTAIMASSNAM